MLILAGSSLLASLIFVRSLHAAISRRRINFAASTSSSDSSFSMVARSLRCARLMTLADERVDDDCGEGD